MERWNEALNIGHACKKSGSAPYMRWLVAVYMLMQNGTGAILAGDNAIRHVERVFREDTKCIVCEWLELMAFHLKAWFEKVPVLLCERKIMNQRG
jgi:hypothetical protein